jgi:hypothetical protein
MSTNALKVSDDMPIQSDHLPLITYYFFLSLLYSLISFVWFFVVDRLKSVKHVPSFILKLNALLEKTKKVQTNNETDKLNECISFLNEIAFTLMFSIMSISFIVIWTIISS